MPGSLKGGELLPWNRHRCVGWRSGMVWRVIRRLLQEGLCGSKD